MDLHTITFRAQIPSCGKAEYRLVPAETPVRYFKKLESGVNYAENKFIRLDIAADGGLSITNKRNGKVYSQLCYLVDDGEIGDGWYHANPVCDRAVFSVGMPCTIEKIENGPSRCVFRITKYLEIPKEIRIDKNGKSRSESCVKLKFIFQAGLSEENSFVDVKLSYDNIAKDHRLRMLIPTGIRGDKYFAGQAFCCVERKVGRDAATQTWGEPEQYEKATNGIVGKRDNDKDGIAVISAAGLHECGAYADEAGTLAVTLSRSFSTAVKTNGQSRCQINMPLEYRFHISVLNSDVEYADLVKQQDAMAARIHTSFVSTAPGSGLNAPESLISVTGENIVTSVIKCAEDDGGIIVRVFNPSDRKTAARISVRQNIAKAELVHLNEEVIREVHCVNKNAVEIEAAPWRIETVKLCFRE